MESAKRVIVALDVDSASEALDIASELKGNAAAFKVGLQLFAAGGPDVVRQLARENRIFLDLKFHDIPTTVRRPASKRRGLVYGCSMSTHRADAR
jgi:orotidine-5'-phosphate decarboxylase